MPFSKKTEMLAYSIAITFACHNFVRVHRPLKTTPAVAAGFVPRKWRIEDLVELADAPAFSKNQNSNGPTTSLRRSLTLLAAVS